VTDEDDDREAEIQKRVDPNCPECRGTSWVSDNDDDNDLCVGPDGRQWRSVSVGDIRRRMDALSSRS
jgi:hypothetical protein